MRFAVLGPLHATVNGRSVDIERPRWRSILAFLLLQNDRPVTTDMIVSAVWGGQAVSTAPTQVHTAISALRRKFRAAGVENLIHNRQSGYTMDVASFQFDAAEFSLAVVEARRPAAGDASVENLRRALALWRGQALEGVSGAFVQGARTRLEEEQLEAVERLMELELTRGNHSDVTAELLGYIEAHPLRESLVRLLILALYRSGRKSDALREYSRIRERLTIELGVEPGPELRELYLKVLQDDPTLRQAPPHPTFSASTPGPHTLPRQSAAFTGRSAERAQLARVLAQPRQGPTVVALNGSGGVGKSVLAVRLAHDLAEVHPGGQIYVDLFGSSPGLAPLSATEVLRRCLRGLGVSESDIPAGEDEAAHSLRQHSDGSPRLLVLDNAVHAAQVDPVVDALASGSVIVTSRAPLDLPTACIHMRIDALPPADAVALLDKVAGRTGDDRESFNQIAAHCDYLPLALSVAAGRLAREPDLSGARLASNLADHRERMTVLEADGVGVRSSIRVGYDLIAAGSGAVDRLAARVFCVIGLVPLPSVDAGVIAALLTPDDPSLVESALNRLARMRLISGDGDGFFRIHDIVRSAAAEYAAETLTSQERSRLRRLAVEYFAACVLLAGEMLRPERKSDGPAPGDLAPPQVLALALRTPDDVGPWLDRALPNIIAASQLAVDTAGETARHAVTMAEALSWVLRKRGEFHRDHALAVNAVSAAEGLGDAAALRRALIHRGRVEVFLGSYDDAAVHINRALESARADGDVSACFSALNDLALVAIRRDDLPQARQLLLEGAELASQQPPRARLIVMHNLAVVHALLAEWSQAAELLRSSLALHRESADRAGVGTDLVLLGVTECALGDFDAAVLRLNEGVAVCEDLGDRVDSWFGLAALTHLHLSQGRRLEAVVVGQRCLASARTLNRPYAEKVAHDFLAKAHHAAGEEVDGRMHARRASAIDDPPAAPEDRILAGMLSSS